MNVLLAQKYGLSINVAGPIIGNVGTTMSVKTNCHLLLPVSKCLVPRVFLLPRRPVGEEKRAYRWYTGFVPSRVEVWMSR